MKRVVAQELLVRVGEKLSEKGLQCLGVMRESAQFTRYGHHDVAEGPASDNAVIGENDKTGHNAEKTNPLPRAASRLSLSQHAESTDRVLLALPPEQDLRNHNRNPDHRDRREIDEHEGAAIVLEGDIWKFPEVSESDGAASRRKNESQVTAPLRTLLRHSASPSHHYVANGNEAGARVSNVNIVPVASYCLCAPLPLDSPPVGA